MWKGFRLIVNRKYCSLLGFCTDFVRALPDAYAMLEFHDAYLFKIVVNPRCLFSVHQVTANSIYHHYYYQRYYLFSIAAKLINDRWIISPDKIKINDVIPLCIMYDHISKKNNKRKVFSNNAK